MKRLISSQRFGMIAEICDNHAMEIAESALKRGLKPIEATRFALKARLNAEKALNDMCDNDVIALYETLVCDR